MVCNVGIFTADMGNGGREGNVEGGWKGSAFFACGVGGAGAGARWDGRRVEWKGGPFLGLAKREFGDE